MSPYERHRRAVALRREADELGFVVIPAERVRMLAGSVDLPIAYTDHPRDDVRLLVRRSAIHHLGRSFADELAHRSDLLTTRTIPSGRSDPLIETVRVEAQVMVFAPREDDLENLPGVAPLRMLDA